MRVHAGTELEIQGINGNVINTQTLGAFDIEITLISFFVHHMSMSLLTAKTKTMNTESNSSYCDVESNTVCSPKMKTYKKRAK